MSPHCVLQYSMKVHILIAELQLSKIDSAAVAITGGIYLCSFWAAFVQPHRLSVVDNMSSGITGTVQE